MEGLEQTAKLLKLIRERGFHPGDKLPSERDLAALFGMSRGAVREALIRLDTLRIIESRPKSGIYLRPFAAERSIEAMVLFTETDTPLSEDDVVQSVELRSVLESEAMRLACLRRTPADLDRLNQILQDSAAAISRGETLAELDADFHKAIVAATQNHVLLRFINVFYLMSRKRRWIYFQEKDQSRRSHAQHLQIYRAIAAQDVEGGQKILRRHIKGVDAYFRMFFAEGHGDRNAAARPAEAVQRAAPPVRKTARGKPNGRAIRKVAA
jgi:GntR family transcriptional regulator, transcriptional repressor for pyruvate dehydrogenase complex